MAAAVTAADDAVAATAAAEAAESNKARMFAWLALALSLYWAGVFFLWWTRMKHRQHERPRWRWGAIARRARAELQRRFGAAAAARGRAESPPPPRRRRNHPPPRESRVPEEVRSPALVERAARCGGRRGAANRSPDAPHRSPDTARRRPVDTPRVRARESPARTDDPAHMHDAGAPPRTTAHRVHRDAAESFSRIKWRKAPGPGSAPRSPDAEYARGGRGETERRSVAGELAVDARPGGSRKQQSPGASPPLRRHKSDPPMATSAARARQSAMVAMRPTPSTRVAMHGDFDVRVCLMPGDDNVYLDAFVADLPQRRSLSLPRLPSHGGVSERTQEAGGALRLVYNSPHGVPSARTVEAEAVSRSQSFVSSRSMCPVVPDWNLWFKDVQRANARRVSPKESERSLRGSRPERAQGAGRGRHLGRRGERGQGGPGAASCQPQCVDSSSDIDAAVSDASTIPNRKPRESLAANHAA
jgi:hypothetical protein